jgi:hypothetical protein
MNRYAARLLETVLLMSVMLVTGCATITGTETQSLSLQALDAKGEAVADTECKLTNDKGTWRAKPPTTTTVTRSAEDLLVQCDAEGEQTGTVRAVSRANSGLFGNIIFGGGVGAIIDHTKGTAYDYPSIIRVVFGMTKVVDKLEDPGTAPSMPSTPLTPPQASPSADTLRPSDSRVSIDDLNDLLPRK